MTLLSTELELQAWLPAVRKIARAAAAEILKIYETDIAVETKADSSPLTQADLAAHQTICAGLAKLTPDIPVLSEESVTIPYSERSSWPRYWLVDPLDGTKEFIKKNGEFTVNIALIDGHQSALGVVHVPVTNTCYSAAVGCGCTKQVADFAPTQLHTRQADPQHLVLCGSRSHGAEALQTFVDNLPGNVKLIAKGSSLKLCMVAEGEADLYPRFGLTSEWDTAAAQCIVEQAGGAVTTLDFEPLLYNAKENILNPHFLVIADEKFAWREALATKGV